MTDLGSLIKPGVFALSTVGAGILYSLLASETNEYFADDNTATSWMSAIFVMALVLMVVLFTTGCGDPFNIRVNGQDMKNRIAVSAAVSVILNAVLAFVYFTSFTNNPNFKRKTFFIFAAVLQFLVLASGVFFMIKARADFGRSSSGPVITRTAPIGGVSYPQNVQGNKMGYTNGT
jgi:hypothetical protein